MAQYSTLKNRLHEMLLFRRRLIIAIIITALLSIILIVQLCSLQIMQYRYYKTLSTKNEIDLDPIPPRRGLIYDRNGVLIAQNIPVFNLMILPSKIKDLDSTISELCNIISITPTDLEQFNKDRKQRRRFEYIPIKFKLTPEEVARFSVNRFRFPNVKVQAALLRLYPLNDTMTSVLGYVGRINEQELARLDPANYAATNFIGKIGIEKHYETLLHGTVGYRKVETDASGATLRTLDNIPATAGTDIYLTIDSKLQAAAKKALGTHSGAVVAIDPTTGEVLALASNPTYDPNPFVNGISQKDYHKLQTDTAHPLYNRTLRGLYPPGSTVKPFIALEGLNSGITSTQFELFDPGWYKLPNSSHIFHDWKLGGHGWVNISKAIIESVDTYFYDLAYKMGIERLDDILNQFGFDQPTGIDMNEELTGNIPTPEWKMRNRGKSWYPADTILSGIGQTFMQVTPLQLASATAVLANRGIHFKPYLLYATQFADQPMQYTTPSQLAPIVLQKEEYWNTVINAMQKVITEGTGHRFGHAEYSVAAKTGTAQVVNSEYEFNHADKIPKQLRNNSVFIAFAPVQHPKIAISVVIENSPEAPSVARQVMDYYLVTENAEKPKTQDTKHATL